ncbi:MAG: glycosyltransferase [Bacteroidales bacterium]|jgi:glycosyltransferase involved in cell wall biosynthesis|nr:glycosyltransferase [Bacteroidales bacterium]
MKIAILSPFYPYRGGIAQFSAMLYQTLAEENEVKAFSFSRLYPKILFPGKTQYVNENDGSMMIPSERILDSINPFSWQKTEQSIERFQPDILIVAHWMSFFAPAYGYIAGRLKNKTKIITLLHNAIPHEPRFFDKAFSKLLFERTHGFVVLSDTVKNDILSLYPQAKYILKPHPLYMHFGERLETTAARKQLGIDPEKKTLLFFGFIRDYKGLDLLIEAMSALDESYQLVIAGESYGPFDNYRKQIDVSPAKQRITVLNRYIDDHEVPVLFSASDVLVVPYRSATQSGVIPIAYHFEVPVLATDTGALRETIEPAETGIICQPDAAAIAEGVKKLFDKGISLFAANIREEKANLSWDGFAQSLIAFAKELTDKKSPSQLVGRA